MSQVNILLKSIYEIKNNEAIYGMQSIRAAVWAEEKDFKKITESSGVKVQEEKTPSVPDKWITRK